MLTDSFHKPGFNSQARILHHLFRVVQEGPITGPLWDVTQQGPAAFPDNRAYVQQFVKGQLMASFPNMSEK